MSLPLHWSVGCLAAANISLDHAAKRPEMLASFTHCERPREQSCIDPLDAASMKILRLCRVDALMRELRFARTSMIKCRYDADLYVRTGSIPYYLPKNWLCSPLFKFDFLYDDHQSLFALSKA